ncbi:MAG: hypothetical protein Tsb0032_17380 [Kiloniellaceae bacterium]
MYNLEQINRLRLLMRRLTLVLSLTICLAVPVTYFLVSYGHQAEDIRARASVAADHLATYAYAHGPAWIYAEERLEEIIAETQVPGHPLYQVLLQPDGREIVHHAEDPGWPSHSECLDVVVAGQTVAMMWATMSMIPLLQHTALAALLAFLLGGSVYLFMHRLPLRVLEQTLVQLQQSLEAIEAHATETTYAYEELKRQHRLVEETTQELMRARDQAEAADRTKSAFLATMSHELRTPLNAIIGFSEMMTQEVFGPLGNARYHDYCGTIGDSGRHLLAVINDVLDISKVEAGKLQLHFEEVDLQDLLEDCRRLVRAKVLEEGVELTVFPAAESLPKLWADPVKLKQIVLNLLSNALKFTGCGGRITLRTVCVDGEGVYLSVADSGIGMTEEEVAVALQPFQQVDNALTRKFEGTGLGLPLAKALAERHGGGLEVRSRPGEGTVVTVFLPERRSLSAPAA